jgi:hypothetical protein
MTPKEKAFKLVIDKYYNLNCISKIEDAKQCALIAVDEILKNNNKIPGNANGLHTFENTSYWQQVKQEIEKL